MIRDPELVHRILLAIEAKASTALQPIKLENTNEQDVLNHLASLHEEGLISGPRPHRSSSTGEVDQVLVRDLTPAGRKLLAGLKEAHSGEPYTPLAVEFAAGANGRRTAVGKSIQRNQVAIVLQLDVLLIMVQNKLEALRNERPNAVDSKAKQAEAIKLFESFERELQTIRDKTIGLERGTTNEKIAEQAAKSFGEYVRDWFDQKHVEILTKSFDITLFLLSTSVCSALGTGGQLAAVVSGAIVGGKPVNRCSQGLCSA
jgi:hypothetical protein